MGKQNKIYHDLQFRILLTGVLLILFIGMMFYHFVENLNFVDALYFSVITLTTVGYGDISPQTQIGKLFTIFYLFTGLGMIFAFVDVIAKRRIAQKIILKKLNGGKIKNEK